MSASAGVVELAGTRRWPRYVGLAAGFLLGLVLLYSAWGKALDAGGIGGLYARIGLFPGEWATAIVVAGVVVEAALAGALLVALRSRWILAVATILMAAFFGLTAYEYFFPSPNASSCGCFGNLIVRTPRQAFIGDGVFLALAGLSWVGAPSGVRFGRRWLAPAALGVAALAVALAAPSLPIDDWATQLKPGARVADLRLDEIFPELQRGSSLVLLLDRADGKTRAEIKRVNSGLAMVDGATPVFGLAEENEELAAEFTWTAGPAFEVRGAPFALLKPLYRTLPRAFLVEDGTVRQVWNAIPEDAALAALSRGSKP